MANPFVNIPVPASPGAGPGAWVDISGQNSILLVMNPFAAPDDLIAFDQNFDGATPQALGFSLSGVAGGVIEVDGGQIRARRVAGSGGAYNAQCIGQGQAGAPAAQAIAVGANPGVYGPIDISGQPANLNVALTGSNDAIGIEHSLDGVNFVPLGSVSNGQSSVFNSGANSLQAHRNGGGGTAGSLKVNGVPNK